MDEPINRISSPISTGAGGPEFERHTDAYWLALLAVRSIPPILIDCVVEEVHLQAKRLGWDTDDTVVVAAKCEWGSATVGVSGEAIVPDQCQRSRLLQDGSKLLA